MAIENQLARCIIPAALLFLVPELFLQAQVSPETGSGGNIKQEINSFSPSVFVEDANAVHELVIFTENLDPDAEIYLRHSDGTLIEPKIYIHENGSYARLSFDNSQLIPGDYEIVIRIHNQAETSKKGFTIVPRQEKPDAVKENPVQIYLAGTYALGETLFHSVYIGVSLKLDFFKFCLEMAHTDKDPFINLDFRLITQYVPHERIAIPLFLGGGFDKQENLDGHISISFSLLQVWLTKHIFAELPGFDYTYSFGKKSHSFCWRFLTMGLHS
jgi:hypothetical protein